jgi:putative ABC transport system permease protein
MAIPIAYNIRNLKLRKGLTIMTALGIALTVTTAVFLMALLAGLDKAFVASGSPLNVLVLRKGSTAELSGGFDGALFPTLRELPGVSKNSKGEPLASGEWVVVIVLPRKDGTGEVNVSVRGMMPAGLELRPNVKLTDGRWFTPGQREVVVGKNIHSRFSGTNVGDVLDFAKGKWTVVGVFDAGGTAYDSELWGDVNQIAADFDRQGGYSSAYLRATDPVAADALKNRVSDDQRLKLDGMLETEYYAKQTSSGKPIQIIGTFVAIIMAIGSCFAADEYDVRGCRIPRPRDRNAACDWIFSAEYPNFVRARSAVAVAAWVDPRNSSDVALQRADHRRGQPSDVQRDGVQFADDPAGHSDLDCLRASDGLARGTCASLACGASEYFDCPARLTEAPRELTI